MKILLIIMCCLVVACGYKGNLYLPKPNDEAKFGAIQTGINFKHSDVKTASEAVHLEQ